MSESAATAPAAVTEATAPTAGKASLARKIGGKTAWVAAGRFGDMLAVFGANAILGWWFPEEAQFKSFFVIFNVVALLSICGTLGLNRSIVRFVSEQLGAGRTADAESTLRRAIAITLAGAAVVAIGMGVWAAVAFEEHGAATACWLAIGVFLRTVQRFIGEALRAYDEIRGASLFAGQNAGQAAGPVSDLIFLALLIAAYLVAEPSLPLVIALNALSLVGSLPLGWVLLKRVIGASHGKAHEELGVVADAANSGAVDGIEADAIAGPASYRQLVAVSVGVLATQVLIFTAWHSDLWLADWFLPDADAAHFATARNLLITVMAPLALINLAVVASIPLLYGQKRLSELQDLLRMASTLGGLPTLVAIVGMTVLAGPVLSVAFGAKWAAAAPILIILSLGRLANAWAGIASFALMMTGYERTHLAISAAATAVQWLLAPLAARQYGVTAMAVVCAAVFLAHHVALWWAVHKRLGVWSHASFGELTALSPKKLRKLLSRPAAR